MTESHHSFLRGSFYMVLSAGTLALTYFFAKLSTPKIAFIPLVFLRFFIPFLLCTITFLIRRSSLKTKYLKQHILRACFVLAAQYCIFYYLTKDSLLHATVLLNTTPLFIPLIEWIFLKYKIPKSTWISAVISAIGVMLILQPGSTLFSLISIIGLFGGLFLACSQVTFGFTANRESIEINAFYLFATGSLVALFPLIERGDLFEIKWSFSLISFLLLLALASISNQYLRAKAYTFGKPSTLTTFLYLSVPLSGLLDWVVFNDIPNALSIVGATLVVLGGISKVGLRFYFLHKKNTL